MARPGLLASLIALLTGGFLLAASPAGATVFAPEQAASPNADEITTVYWVVLVVGVVIFLAINAAIVMAVVRFRARRDVEPARVQSGRGLQGRVAAGLGVLAVALYVFGIIFTERTRDVEASGPDGLQASTALSAQTGVGQPASDVEPLVINVIGQRWLWRFEYPGGRPGDLTYSYQELVVPADTTVLLRITSTDVLHRWWVPALGGNVDALPGQHQETWFKAEEEGTYEGQSAAFSGPSYPTMRATVRVVSPEDYQVWLDQQEADLTAAQGFVKEIVEAESEAAAEEPVESGGGGGGE